MCPVLCRREGIRARATDIRVDIPYFHEPPDDCLHIKLLCLSRVYCPCLLLSMLNICRSEYWGCRVFSMFSFYSSFRRIRHRANTLPLSGFQCVVLVLFVLSLLHSIVKNLEFIGIFFLVNGAAFSAPATNRCTLLFFAKVPRLLLALKDFRSSGTKTRFGCKLPLRKYCCTISKI